MQRFTVEERAVRFQRRYSGSWRTVRHEIAGVGVTYRYRRRFRFLPLTVAVHDLCVHAVWRGALLPALLPVVKWLARHLPATTEGQDG